MTVINPTVPAIGGPISGGTRGSILYISPNGIFAQDNANLFYNDINDTLQLGYNGSIDSNVKFFALSGTKGTMGFPYESAVFERSGDQKFGVYSSDAFGDASIVLGQTGATDINGYYTGFEFQYVADSNPADNYIRYNFLERDSSGNVTGPAIKVDLLRIQGDNKVGVGGIKPFDTFVSAGAVHSIGQVGTSQSEDIYMEYIPGFGLGGFSIVGGDPSSYPSLHMDIHSDSADSLPFVTAIQMTGDTTNFQALVGINTASSKPLTVFGNGAESGMVVFGDTVSGNTMTFGNSGGTSDADMNIWTSTGILNIGDGLSGAEIRIFNGGSGVSAQLAGDGNNSYVIADGNGYFGINTASPIGVLAINDRGLGDTNPSLSVFDNDAGAYGVALFSSSLRQFNIGCQTDLSATIFSFDYASEWFNVYDTSGAGGLNHRLAATASDVSCFGLLGSSIGFGTATPSQFVDVNGNIRLRSAIYDQTNSPGSNTNILSNNGSGGAWKTPIAAGISQVITTVSLTNQSADIGSTNFTGTNVAGLYRVSYSLEDTTSDITAGAVTLTIAYTDTAGSATSISSAQVLTGAGRTSGSLFLQLASGSISYSTSHTGLFGTAKYALYCTVERML